MNTGPYPARVHPVRRRDHDGLACAEGPSLSALPLPRRSLWHRNGPNVCVCVFSESVFISLGSHPTYVLDHHPFSFNPSIAVLGHWFRRRRATAIGIALGGSSVGGVVFPILLQRLIPLVGFAWAVRAIGFVMMACFVVACLTIKTRLPLSGRISWRTAVDVHGFKDPRYVLTAISGFLYVSVTLAQWSVLTTYVISRLFYAVYTPIFYIEIYASFRGISPEVSSYLLPILNAGNVLSRILPGILSDRVGP